jgi:uncharacterized protein with PQ loop repeat
MYLKNFFIDLVEESIEYYNRDNYLFIIGLMIASLMFLAQVWGLISQNQKILKGDTKALSLIFFVGQCLYLFGYAYYGLETQSLTVTISSLSFPFFLPIIFTIIKNNFYLIKIENNKKEKKYLIKKLRVDLWLSGIFSLIVIMLITNIRDKNLFLTLLLAAVIISIIPQIYSVFKYKTLKNISVKYIVGLIISSALYLIYGILMEFFVQESWGIIVTGIISLVGTIIFYKIKRSAN